MTPLLYIIIWLYVGSISKSQRIFPNGTRNKYEWPFINTSIWNYPIGSNAEYVHAGINGSTHFGVDPDWWIITNSSNPTYDWYKPYEWDNRCEVNSSVNGKPYPFKVPFPSNQIVPNSHLHYTPNDAGAILLPDGKSLLELGPLCRDEIDGPIFGNRAYDCDPYNDSFPSIYGQGLYGAHFGSGLSSIGGTVRLGELNKSEIHEPFRHALKWELWAHQYLYNPHNGNDSYSECSRWPAINCDSYWLNNYNGTVNATRMGSLLAIPPSIAHDLNNTLQTLPGLKVLQGLTDYGAYIVGDSAYDQQMFCVENGVQNEFESEWGWNMFNSTSPFAQDMILISKNLYVVNNNNENNIGGGGSLRQPLAPPIGN